MSSHAWARRVAATLLIAAAALLSLNARPALAESPAGFMQRVANELIAASRVSPQALASVIRSHGDVPTIGLLALGKDYAAKLGKADRPAYYNAMVNWMARYAWKYKGQYPVAKATMVGQSETAEGATVESVVTLQTGETYNVSFILKKRGSVYKVQNAQYLMVTMTDGMAGMFRGFIDGEGKGDPRNLTRALSQ